MSGRSHQDLHAASTSKRTASRRDPESRRVPRGQKVTSRSPGCGDEVHDRVRREAQETPPSSRRPVPRARPPCRSAHRAFTRASRVARGCGVASGRCPASRSRESPWRRPASAPISTYATPCSSASAGASDRIEFATSHQSAATPPPRTKRAARWRSARRCAGCRAPGPRDLRVSAVSGPEGEQFGAKLEAGRFQEPTQRRAARLRAAPVRSGRRPTRDVPARRASSR